MLDLDIPRHAHIKERLREDPLAWLCTVRPDGRPHAVAVWFLLCDDASILIFSKPNQQKLRNIASNPNVLLAIDDTKGGSDPVTIEGKAELLNDPSISTLALPAYIEKYGERMKSIWQEPEKMMAEYSQAICVTPTRFR